MRHRIPIEICPTSNKMTLGLSSLKQHPVLMSIAKDVPFSINTDDTVVFDIDLSHEIQIVAELFEWNEDDLIEYMKCVVDQILDKDPGVRQYILSCLKEFSQNCCFVCFYR